MLISGVFEVIAVDDIGVSKYALYTALKNMAPPYHLENYRTLCLTLQNREGKFEMFLDRYKKGIGLGTGEGGKIRVRDVKLENGVMFLDRGLVEVVDPGEGLDAGLPKLLKRLEHELGIVQQVDGGGREMRDEIEDLPDGFFDDADEMDGLPEDLFNDDHIAYQQKNEPIYISSDNE